MAAPSHRDSTRASINSVGSTSITGTGVAGAAADDIYAVLIFADHSGTSPGTIVANTPADWTQIGTQVNAGNFDIALFWNRRGASNPDFRFNFSALGGFGSAECHVVCMSGAVATGSPLGASAFSTPTTGTQPDPPAVALASNDVLYYAIACSWAGWAVAPTVPTNYSTTGITNGGFLGTCLAWRQIVSSTGDDPGTFGAADGSDSIVAVTLAFVANGGGGGGTPTVTLPGVPPLFFGSFP